MGVAEVIPGVSGSTAALLTGIYQELVNSLKSVNRAAFKLLVKKKFQEFWAHTNGPFLLTLFAGMLTSFLILGRLIMYALKYNPIPLSAFFFSLIFMAVPLVMREEIKKWDTGAIICFVAALLIAYAITLIPPVQIPRVVWMLFFVGLVAGAIAFIPGISFTFILILLGQLGYVTSAITQFTSVSILIFMGGFVVGLLGFSRLVNHGLRKYRKITIAILTGMMLGF